MNGSQILEHFRDQLAEQVIGHRRNLPDTAPLEISPWAAMSLMQKAIRRGREDWAMKGAASLLRTSPDRLWRRLIVTAYEDVGVADFDAVALATAGAKGKRWRSDIGGEWAVASYLISRMCRAAKCRATDDLMGVCERHPDFERSRLEFTFKPLPELLRLVAGPRPLPERALALWYAMGTDRCRSAVLRERSGEPQAVFDALSEWGFPDTVVEVCREGFRKSGELLPAVLILLFRESEPSTHHLAPDDLPEEEMVGPVPCWTFDMHVRQGNQAMARLLEGPCETARWIGAHLPPGRRLRFLKGLLFRVESGLVDRRFRWQLGDQLRRMADYECLGLPAADVAVAAELLRQDLPRLNEERRHVVASNLR